MASLPQVADVLRAALLEIGEPVARSSGFCQRRSKLTAAVFVQALVLGWWQDPAASLRHLCQVAALRGIEISPQGLDQRFTEAGARLLKACLDATLTRMLRGLPVTTPLLARFPAIYLLDSTTITVPDPLATIWPGCGGRVTTNTQAALKCTVALDLRRGSLEQLELTSGRTQDRATAVQATPVPAGALRIADLGFWSLPVFRRIAAGGGYFLSRYHSQTTVSLAGVRLLAIRVPQAVADARRRRIRADARSGGHAAPKRTLALAGWTVLVTNAPASLLTVAEAEVLRRLRWQIELVFKLWKQQGQVAASRSAKPWRILCEVYAKLLAMVLQHGVLLLGGGTFGERNLVQAAATIRGTVLPLTLALDQRRSLCRVLRTIAPLLARVGAPNKRRNRPSAAQLVADPSLIHA